MPLPLSHPSVLFWVFRPQFSTFLICSQQHWKWQTFSELFTLCQAFTHLSFICMQHHMVDITIVLVVQTRKLWFRGRVICSRSQKLISGKACWLHTCALPCTTPPPKQKFSPASVILCDLCPLSPTKKPHPPTLHHSFNKYLLSFTWLQVHLFKNWRPSTAGAKQRPIRDKLCSTLWSGENLLLFLLTLLAKVKSC